MLQNPLASPVLGGAHAPPFDLIDSLKTPAWHSRVAFVILAVALLPLLTLPHAVQSAEGTEEKDPAKETWDVNQARGPTFQQEIDAREGTWINLDVSPDGSRIVFDFLGDLYLMPITGADGKGDVFPRKLTEGIAWDMQPRFSPDGKTIAFTSDRTGHNDRGGDNIWVIRTDGTGLRQITSETFRLLNAPAWSPDGAYIVARKHFTSRRSLGAGEMWLYHAGGVQAEAQTGVQLTERPNDQKDVNEPVFSPDGRYLYYSQDVTPGNTFEYDKDSTKGIYAIKRLDLREGDTQTYISGPGGACRPIPSPDGNLIAFVRRTGNKTALHLFDVQSGAIRMLYDKLERDMQETWAIHGVYPAFAWTPDGRHLVLWAKGKIRKINVSDGSATVIPFHIRDQRTVTKALRHHVDVAPEQFEVKMLRWVQTSPRGDQVVFQALGHLYVRSLPDGAPRRLTSQTNHFEFFPSYSRDGKYLVYTTWNDQSFGSIRIASTTPDAAPENWKVTGNPGHYVEPVFSPDGNSIVYRKVGGGRLRSPLWSLDGGIYRIAAKGGETKLISKNGSQPQFAAETNRVYFVKRNRQKDADNLTLVSTDLDGHDLREHYVSHWATDYRLSPDGQWIAFIERFNVYLAPFLQTGKPVRVGPESKSLPIVKVSETAGDWIHFSGDAGHIHWALGPTLYRHSLRSAYSFLNNGQDTESATPEKTDIGFRTEHDKPPGQVAWVGATILTMGPQEAVENGVVLVSGNRIQAVGQRDQIDIPDGATVFDVTGQIMLPGFIDVHAHGPQATDGITPQQNWIDYARLAFGVTTIHDPSNDTQSIFAAAELAKKGLIVAPRTYSTGTILYGAESSSKAEVNSLDDARFHLERMQAVGAFTVKSYNQPRRDQRQQILAAARELNMMVLPEGGSTFLHNLTMVVDGHTGIEHALPVQNIYQDVLDLWQGTGVGYTPTLSVAYGGLWGENYWYQVDDLWRHDRLMRFAPPDVIPPRARRRIKAPREDYNHIRAARAAKQLFDIGESVQTGGHGQRSGLSTHWEIWSLVQGGMSPIDALLCATLSGARYIGLDRDLGSIEPGKLADLVVLEKGADPMEHIRHSERIQYVMLNGRVYQAPTMDPIGPHRVDRQPFFWKTDGAGQNGGIDHSVHCVSCPAGRFRP